MVQREARLQTLLLIALTSAHGGERLAALEKARALVKAEGIDVHRALGTQAEALEAVEAKVGILARERNRLYAETLALRVENAELRKHIGLDDDAAALMRGLGLIG